MKAIHGAVMLTKDQLNKLTLNLSKGRYETVIIESRRLIKLNPNVAGLYEILGLAYSQSGETKNAVKFFQRALKIMPSLGSARFNLAKVYFETGKITQAISILRNLTSTDYQTELVRHLLGIALFQNGNFIAAANEFNQVLELSPRDHEALFYLGQIARTQGDDNNALDCFLAVLEINPEHFESAFNIGNIYRDKRCLAKALSWFERALKIKPDHLQALMNRGTVQVLLGHQEKGIKDFEDCLKIDPYFMDAYQNLSSAYLHLRDFVAAEKILDSAIQQNPNFVDAVFAKFGLLALQQRYEEALPLGEARLDPRIRFEPQVTVNNSIKTWDGRTKIRDGLFIYAEQGIGDTIMFLRFLDRLPNDLVNVTIAVQEPLVELVAHQYPSIEVINLNSIQKAKRAFQSSADAKCALMSLPYTLRLKTDDRFFAQGERLRVPKAYKDTWKSRLMNTNKPRIGFAFKGNDSHRNDANRSIELSNFLKCLPSGCDYHFLGVDINENERNLLQSHGNVSLHDDRIANFCDTSALISMMDRVVAVDTSVAHLAGTLGIDTHILLPFTPDWRWGLGTSTSVWYQSAKLHRQVVYGDWVAPLTQVADEITQLAMTK